MARINFIVPPLNRRKFTGGIQCIMEYAHGLSARGHVVTLVPLLPSKIPEWYSQRNFKIVNTSAWTPVVNILKFGSKAVVKGLLNGKNNSEFIKYLHSLTTNIAMIEPRILSYESRKGLMLSCVRSFLPEGDITIATSFETALPCNLFGKGKLFYFAQHYEPFFKDETTDPLLAETEALLSYQLGLKLIANSTWLKNKLKETTSEVVPVCVNAINHDNYFPSSDYSRRRDGEIRVISYGGRGAVWKGFNEMAEAVSIARQVLPSINIRWFVYGDASLPPDNNVAPYESLGFLQPKELAEAYRAADILLSASWYESFPLFPLEAMACGLAVITTKAGTEDYAEPEITAEIVPPRDARQIAAGLIRLIQRPDYRAKIAHNGSIAARKFTWERAVSTMEEILLTS
jgi:glycosyltransferase involved in cell wall biosynthesis